VAADASHWMPKSARRQNRENGDTHTHTHTHIHTHTYTHTHIHTNTQDDNYCNPRRTYMPRVNEYVKAGSRNERLIT